MAFSINGRRPGWTLMQITLAQLNKRVVTPQAVTYPGHGVDKMLEYGAGPNPVGYSRDFYKVDKATIELFIDEADVLRAIMGSGYNTYRFDVSISYSGDGIAIRTDQWIGCNISKETPQSPKGAEAHRVTWELQPEQLILNGIPYTLPTTV